MNTQDESISQNAGAAIDWRDWYEKWKTSRLSQKEFCQVNQINYHQFVYQRSKQLSRSKTPSKFLPLTVAKHATSSSVGDSFILHCPNGVRISVPPHFHPETMKALLKCLGVVG